MFSNKLGSKGLRPWKWRKGLLFRNNLGSKGLRPVLTRRKLALEVVSGVIVILDTGNKLAMEVENVTVVM